MKAIDNIKQWNPETVGAFNADVIEAVTEIDLLLAEIKDNLLWLNRATNYCGCTDKLCKAEVKEANQSRKKLNKNK